MCYIKMLRENWKEILITFLLAALAYFIFPAIVQPKSDADINSGLYEFVPLVTVILLLLSFLLGAFISRRNSESFAKQMFVPMASALALGLLTFAFDLIDFFSVSKEAWEEQLAQLIAYSGQEISLQQYQTAIFANDFTKSAMVLFMIIGVAFCAVALFRVLHRKFKPIGKVSKKK